jgi:uncharacterized protein YpiB (UPF0302 family)
MARAEGDRLLVQVKIAFERLQLLQQADEVLQAAAESVH